MFDFDELEEAEDAAAGVAPNETTQPAAEAKQGSVEVATLCGHVADNRERRESTLLADFAPRCTNRGHLQNLVAEEHQKSDKNADSKLASEGCSHTSWQVQVPESLKVKGAKLQALIFLDWDDTLFPTTWLEGRPSLLGEYRMAGQSGPPPNRSGEPWTLLAEQARVVRQLVEQASSFGSAAVITLAERPWVRDSARGFMPEAAEQAAKLDVFYAREHGAAAARPAAGACSYVSLKRRAMEAALECLLGRLGSDTTWQSLISIGDSDIEKRAAQELGRQWQARGVVKHTKTVKLAERSGVVQLTAQVRSLHSKLPDIVAHAGSKHFSATCFMPARR